MAAKDRDYDEPETKDTKATKDTKGKAGEPELSPEGVPYQSSGMPDDRDSVPPGPTEAEALEAQYEADKARLAAQEGA